MFQFKLNNGQLVKYVELDGGYFADLILENIMIKIEFNEHNEVIAKINESDILSLGDINYKPYLLEAQQTALEYIKYNELKQFLTPNRFCVLDIVDENKQSFYRKNIPFIKEVVHLNIQSLCSEAILEKIETIKSNFVVQT